MTLERQAFDAHMRINNGLSHITLEDVNVNVNFQDEEGNDILASSDPENADALFFIHIENKSFYAHPATVDQQVSQQF